MAEGLDRAKLILCQPALGSTHQSSRDKSHTVDIVVQSRHLSPMSVERDWAVAAGDVKQSNDAVAVTNRKLRRVTATSQWCYALLISRKDGNLQPYTPVVLY